MLTSEPSRARRAAVFVLTLAVSGSLLTAGYAVAAGAKSNAKGGGSCRHNCTSTDTTPPSISITSPAASSTVGGLITVSGTASDNIGVAAVAVSIDGGGYVGATGTTSWSIPIDTTAYAGGAHTISARATDNAGNTKVSSQFVNFSNATPAPSPSPSVSPAPSPSSSPLPSPSPTPTISASSGHWVSPEGVTININSTSSWTIAQIYALLKANALDLSTIGPHLTIDVQDTVATGCGASASMSNGVYTNFTAVLYLKALNSAFSAMPDSQFAHVYGHAWTLYHFYITHQGNWSSYLNERWTTADGSVTLAQDSRLDSTYAWSRAEIIAEDYRQLFGSALAKSESQQMNTDIPVAAAQPGLSEFFLNTWA